MTATDTNRPGVLEPDGAAAVSVLNRQGGSRIVLVCEHAGNRIPRSLGDMGLVPAERASHIAWDIGAEGLAREMARKLGAPLVLQRYSRLVYDCNRPPSSAAAIIKISESVEIPANRNLGEAERQARIEAVYRPFREAIATLLDERCGQGAAPVLVTVHSFTRLFDGRRRAVDVGILHDDDRRLADAMLERCQRWADVAVERNRPYGPEDGVTHTLRAHALPRGLRNVMIEVCNDLIADEAGQRAFAARLSEALNAAIDDQGRTAACRSDLRAAR